MRRTAYWTGIGGVVGIVLIACLAGWSLHIFAIFRAADGRPSEVVEARSSRWCALESLAWRPARSRPARGERVERADVQFLDVQVPS